MMKPKQLCVAAACAALLACIPLVRSAEERAPAKEVPNPTTKPSEEQKSAREKQLEEVLKKHPEADTNHDGKLSPDEARAALAKLKAGTLTPAAQPADGAGKGAAAARMAKAGGKAASSNLPKPDFANVSYGDHPNDKFDLWLAKSDQPTPLIVYIHGGGFKAGDKSGASPLALKQCLDAGVSFATINYRFRPEFSINVVLRDPARALQFFRYKAKDYNLDKTRFATFGGSAGAGTSLWLAFHDDLADANAEDPVLRESTRISAAGASACQATYDILKWQEVLGGGEEAMRFSPKSEWPSFYGLKNADELDSEKGKQLRADADMLGLISKDDPPVWLSSSESHEGFATKGDVLHNPKHAEAVKKRCDEIGVKCVLKIEGKAGERGTGSQIDFLINAVKERRPAS